MAEKNHILVVEDEEHLASGIKFNLEAEGYEVTTIADGPAAHQFIEENVDRTNLVILDIMLPGMSGYEICEAIRSAGNDVPVMMLSARTLAEDRSRGFDVGANQYLTKPFELEELLSRVKNLLKFHAQSNKGERVRAVQAKCVRIGKALVDLESYEVTKGQCQSRLTSQEMKLLRYFLDNEGRVIPRSELLEAIWEIKGPIRTRAPDQFIRRLRKIFEEDPGQPRHFLTVRDAGYRFVADPEQTT